MINKISAWFKQSAMALSVSLVAAIACVYAPGVFAAAGGSQTVGDLASNVTGSFSNLAKLITAISYIAGFGFVLGSMFQFKAHKEMPQQNPVGKPIAMFALGAILIFLPAMFGVAEQTIFGGTAQTAGPLGTPTF